MRRIVPLLLIVGCTKAAPIARAPLPSPAPAAPMTTTAVPLEQAPPAAEPEPPPAPRPPSLAEVFDGAPEAKTPQYSLGTGEQGGPGQDLFFRMPSGWIDE